MPIAAPALSQMEPSVIFQMATSTVPGLNEHMLKMHERRLPPLEVSVLIELLTAVQTGQPVVLPPLPDGPGGVQAGHLGDSKVQALLQRADEDGLVLRILSRTIYLGGLPDGTTREEVAEMLRKSTGETPTSVMVLDLFILYKKKDGSLTMDTDTAGALQFRLC